MNNSRLTEEFLELLMENEKKIFTYILTMVTNSWDAEDVMQKTIVVLWRKYSEFSPGTHFAAWAKTIARNVILEHRRDEKRFNVLLSDKVLDLLHRDLEDFSDETVDMRMQYLQICLDKLPKQQRQIIHMRYRLNHSVKQISEEISKSTHVVYRALSRIQQILLRCVRRSLAEGYRS